MTQAAARKRWKNQTSNIFAKSRGRAWKEIEFEWGYNWCVQIVNRPTAHCCLIRSACTTTAVDMVSLGGVLRDLGPALLSRPFLSPSENRRALCEKQQSVVSRPCPLGSRRALWEKQQPAVELEQEVRTRASVPSRHTVFYFETRTKCATTTCVVHTSIFHVLYANRACLADRFRLLQAFMAQRHKRCTLHITYNSSTRHRWRCSTLHSKKAGHSHYG